MYGAMESCPVKTVISGTMGFGLGGVFGLFMASVCFASRSSYPYPVHTSILARKSERARRDTGMGLLCQSLSLTLSLSPQPLTPPNNH